MTSDLKWGRWGDSSLSKPPSAACPPRPCYNASSACTEKYTAAFESFHTFNLQVLFSLASQRNNLSIFHCVTFSDRCVMPLGLEDKRITDGHLTASTYYNHHLSPWHGRLNHRWSWSVRTRRVGEWFQVNFVELMRIKGVATQGRQDSNQWVRRYTIRYSVDGMNFVPYREGRTTKVIVLVMLY